MTPREIPQMLEARLNRVRTKHRNGDSVSDDFDADDLCWLLDAYDSALARAEAQERELVALREYADAQHGFDTFQINVGAYNNIAALADAAERLKWAWINLDALRAQQPPHA